MCRHDATPDSGAAYRPWLQRRLILAFPGFTLLVGVLRGAMAIVFVYAVEDEFFSATLRSEAERQRAHFDAQDSFAAPALPFVRLYPQGRSLPADLDLLHIRTRDLIAREQAFTADASHELRTPLAVLGLAADRLHGQATAEQLPLVRSLQAAVWQLQQTVDVMLALAREAPTGAPDAPELPLLPMLERLVLVHAPLRDREGVQVELDVYATLTRPWSRALTHLLVGNLLANAIAHAQAPRILIEADATELRVHNPSPPPPAVLLGAGAAGRDRGVRGAASTGQGLGLATLRKARSPANAHPAPLSAHRSA